MSTSLKCIILIISACLSAGSRNYVTLNAPCDDEMYTDLSEYSFTRYPHWLERIIQIFMVKTIQDDKRSFKHAEFPVVGPKIVSDDDLVLYETRPSDHKTASVVDELYGEGFDCFGWASDNMFDLMAKKPFLGDFMIMGITNKSTSCQSRISKDEQDAWSKQVKAFHNIAFSRSFNPFGGYAHPQPRSPPQPPIVNIPDLSHLKNLDFSNIDFSKIDLSGMP